MTNYLVDNVLDAIKRFVTKAKRAKYVENFKTVVNRYGGNIEKESEIALQNTTNCNNTSYEVVFHQDESDSDRISDVSTNDSGVIMNKTVVNPELSNSPIITHAIIENPLPEHWYHFNTTHDKTEIETGKAVTDAVHENFTEENNNFVRPINDRFVVNLFESRQSNRWKRKSIRVNNLDTIHIIKDEDTPQEITQEPPSAYIINDSALRSEPNLYSDAMYYKLKKLRDIECVKMKEASNALKAIKKKSDKEWSEELLAETILLETDLKYKLIVNKIRDLSYSEDKLQKTKHSGTITLSNFQYDLKPQEIKNVKYLEFFVLALSHGTELTMTKAVTPSEGTLIFNETFTFRNIAQNFNIKIELFCIKLRINKERKSANFLKRKSKVLCPMSKIYYENVNTYEVQESTILKPSFISQGDVIITKEQIGNTSFIISELPFDSRVTNTVKANLFVDSLNLKSDMSGFLTLGKPDNQNNIIFWNRIWCSLKGSQFSIYNYPQEEAYDTPPVATVNLEYCFAPVTTQLSNCPKRNTFVLKTGRPGVADETRNTMLGRKNNFVLEKYYLSADNNVDLERWTSELNSALECLRDWQRLVFENEYE